MKFFYLHGYHFPTIWHAKCSQYHQEDNIVHCSENIFKYRYTVQVLFFPILLKASSSSMIEIEGSIRLSNSYTPPMVRVRSSKAFCWEQSTSVIFLSPVSICISLEKKYDFNLIPNFTWSRVGLKLDRSNKAEQYCSFNDYCLML